MTFLSDTDTYSGDMREKFVVDGVVVDEDFKEDVRRPRAADFFKIRLERLLPLMRFNC